MLHTVQEFVVHDAAGKPTGMENPRLKAENHLVILQALLRAVPDYRVCAPRPYEEELRILEKLLQAEP